MKTSLNLFVIFLLLLTSCKKDNKFLDTGEVFRVTHEDGKHQAFTDLVYFNNKFYLVFRESNKHVNGNNGTIKLMQSSTAENWVLIKEFVVNGVDLRDPKFSVNGDILNLYIHGSIYKNGVLDQFIDYRYQFNDDWVSGEAVTLDNVQPTKSLVKGNEAWPWRVTWFNNYAYSVGYNGVDIFSLYRSVNGLEFENVSNFNFINNKPSESTIRFDSNGEAYILIRRNEGTTLLAKYKDNTLNILKEIPITNFGGPNFLLYNNKVLMAGRNEGGRLVLCEYDLNSNNYKHLLIIPSGGDATYPGMVIKDNILYISYYSSHQNTFGSSIFLAKIKLDGL